MVTRMVAFFTCFYIFMQLSLHACLFAPPGLEPRRQQQQQPTTIAPSNAALSIDPADNFSSKGRQGPKSLGRAPQNTSASQHACSADPRVAARAAGAAGADSQVRNITADGPAKPGSGAFPSSRIQSRKRAYRRACRRALASADGTTIYRGRLCTAAGLGCSRSPLQGQPSASRRGTVRQQAAGQRLRVCSFNLGGFCTASYDTFKVWLEDNGHRFDLLLLQETHFGLGKEPREYQLPGWTVISSPDSSLGRSCSPGLPPAASSLQYCIVVPGRLLHVKGTPTHAASTASARRGAKSTSFSHLCHKPMRRLSKPTPIATLTTHRGEVAASTTQ